jgi:hypothetical protein
MKYFILTPIVGSVIIIQSQNALGASSCSSISRLEASHILRYTPNSLSSSGKSLHIDGLDSQLGACKGQGCPPEDIKVGTPIPSQGKGCSVEVNVPKINVTGNINYSHQE